MGKTRLGDVESHVNSSEEGSSIIRVPLETNIATLQPYYLEIGGMKHVPSRIHAVTPRLDSRRVNFLTLLIVNLQELQEKNTKAKSGPVSDTSMMLLQGRVAALGKELDLLHEQLRQVHGWIPEPANVIDGGMVMKSYFCGDGCPIHNLVKSLPSASGRVHAEPGPTHSL